MLWKSHLKGVGHFGGSVLRAGVLLRSQLRGRVEVEVTVMGDIVYLITAHTNIKGK